MQWAREIQSTFLDMPRSTTSGLIPHSALELRLGEITTPATQLEVQRQAAPLEQFSENHVIDQSTCQAADRSPQQCLRLYQHKRLKIKVADVIRIILCPEVTVVDAKHTLRRQICFVCLRNILRQTCIHMYSRAYNSLSRKRCSSR
jgi:hypothetical protein